MGRKERQKQRYIQEQISRIKRLKALRKKGELLESNSFFIMDNEGEDLRKESKKIETFCKSPDNLWA